MQCRNCGTEIADKALICFRCGTATTEAKFKPPPRRAGPPRATLRVLLGPGLLTIVVVAALAVLLATCVGRC